MGVRSRKGCESASFNRALCQPAIRAILGYSRAKGQSKRWRTAVRVSGGQNGGQFKLGASERS
eukprot:1315565-Alexandrium_andersonii.AAC.1